LNSSLATPIIIAEKNLDLIKSITKNKIYATIFQMDPHKAPGFRFLPLLFSKNNIGPLLKINYTLLFKIFLTLGNFSKR